MEKWEIPTRTEENGKNILPDVAASINEKVKKNIWIPPRSRAWASECPDL